VSASDSRSWVLGDRGHRATVGGIVQGSPQGWIVTIDPPRRSFLQNRLLHARLGEVANQLPWPKDTGELHDVEWWKRRCTLQWLIDNKEPVEVITDLDGRGDFGLLLPHTSDLTTAQCASLNEFILSFGSMNGVTFKETA